MKKNLKLIAVILAMFLLCSCSDAENDKVSQVTTDQKQEQQETTSQKQEQQETTSQKQEQQEATTQKQEQQETTNKKPEQQISGKEDTKPGADNKEPVYNDNVTDKLVIKLHYHRSDNNYADWSVWGWEFGCNGTDYPLIKENGEMVATMPVSTGVESFGYIVRTPEWEKDVVSDQFIDCIPYVTGTLHVFVESGVPGHTVQEGKDIVKSGHGQGGNNTPSNDNIDDGKKDQLVAAAKPVVDAYANEMCDGMYDFIVVVFSDIDGDGTAELFVAESMATGALPGNVYKYENGKYVFKANIMHALAESYKNAKSELLLLQYSAKGTNAQGEYMEEIWLTNVNANTSKHLCSIADETSFFDAKGNKIDEATYEKIISDAIAGCKKLDTAKAYSSLFSQDLDKELKSIYEDYLRESSK